MKVTIIPIVVGALGIIPKNLEKRFCARNIRRTWKSLETKLCDRNLRKQITR